MASLAVWTMLAMLVVPVVQIGVAAAPAAAASGVPVTSADGKLTLTKTATPTSLPYGGGTVTYTYTVKNNTAGRMYYDGMSDNKCRPSYVSGMSSSFFYGDYIPAGGTATFSCTQLITADTTNTATASFSNGSGIQSSVSATATVTVNRPATGNTSCDFIYASTIYLGTDLTPAGAVSIWPNATGINIPSNYLVGGVAADSSAALAIDPLNPNTAYLTLRTEAGAFYPYLMKVDLSTGVWTEITVTNSTPAAWSSNRLAVDRYGHVWSFANGGLLYEYDPATGTTTAHGIPQTYTVTDPNGVALFTIDFGTLSSGDIAFDGDNNLWILAANGTTNTTYLVTIPYASLDAGTGTTRTTGPTVTYLGTVTNPVTGGYYNGLAFGTNGTLYASSYNGNTSYLYTLNSATGASTQVGSAALDGLIGDLASCAIPKPNLQVSKTADKDVVQAGDQITYTVKITNTSTLASTGTTFVDALPANTTYVSSTLNGTAITGATNPWQTAREVHGTSTTRAGLLPGGETATITITVKVNSPLPAGTTNIVNQGTADYTGNSTPIKSDDPTLSGSTDPTTTGIVAPSMSLDKTADKTAIAGSGLVTYTYALSNTGNVAITTPAVSDDKCSPLALKPADQTALTGDLDADGVLDVGEVWYFTCATTLTWTSTNTSVTNTATATGKYGTTNLPATDTWTVTLSPAPASINVSKTAGTVTGPDASGTYSVTYTVSVRNTGQTAGSYGPITDTPQFSSNLTATGATWVGQSSGSATGSGPYSIGAANTSLAAGGTHTYTVTVTFKFTTFTAATACGGAGTGLYNSVSLPAGQEQGATTDNSACVTPPPPPAPAITLTKSAGPINDLDSNGHDPGDTIAYSFTVKSTGNTPLASITLTDAKCDTGTLTRTGGDTNSDSVLQTTETWTYTCTHTLTAADITAGSVVNTASASGTFAGTAYTSTASTTTTIAKPAITLDKQTGTYIDTNANGRIDAGDTMTYNFVVVNTGNTSLTNIALTDPKLTAAGLSITCPTSTLAAGGSMTCTSTAYTFTTADQTAGTFTNTASVTGVPPSGPSVSATDSVTVTLTYAAISIVKSEASRNQGTDGRLNAGDTITYQFVVTNTGQVPLTGVTISDPKLAGLTIPCPSTSLAAGASMTCTAAPYTVTAADQTAGQIVNTAAVTATPPSGTNITASSTLVTPVQYAAVDLRKIVEEVKDVPPSAQGQGNGLIDRDDTILYKFAVTNTGNIPLNSFTVTDPKLVGLTITCPPGPLAPAATAYCTVSAPYTITQADANAGEAVNTATVTATPSVGTAVTDTDTASVAVQNPEILLDKTAGPVVDFNGNGLQDAGDRITYTFTVTNPGRINEQNVTVVDPQCNTSGVTYVSGDNNPANGMLDGVRQATRTETWVFTCVHTITAAEADLGQVDNVATVTGHPEGAAVGVTISSPPDSTNTPLTRTGAMTMTKSVYATSPATSPFSFSAVGQQITYHFTVRNTGSVSLGSVTIVDAKCDTAATLLTGDTDGDVRLDTTEIWVFQCVHTVTQADLDNLKVVNTATASGTTPMGTTLTSTPSTATVNATVTSGITIDKLVSSQSANPISAVGQTITYDFVVDNTGTTSLSSVSVTDSRCTTTLLSGDTNADGKLQPNELWTYRCTYSVTQADLDAGSIVNTATAKGTPSGSATPITSTPDTVTVVTAAPGAMSILKSGSAPTDIDGDGLVEPGDTITYRFTVANTGSVALSSVQVVDDRCTTTPTRTTGDTDGDGKLDVTETWIFTCTKTLTAADISAGTVHNKAYAQGTTPGGTTVTSPNATFDTTIPQVARLTLDKALATPASPVTDLDGNGPDAGDTIAYTFTVTNTGNVTLAPVTLTDSKLGLNGTLCVSSLAPGATVQCTGTFLYTISVAESNAGSVLNTATATGTPAMGAPATATDSVTATLTPNPAIHLAKSGQATDVNGDGILTAGVDTIVYSFTVTNTGGITLNSVYVSDPSLTALNIACSPASLDPGQTATCSASRLITSADFTLTYAANTATAHGSPVTGGAEVTHAASAITPVLQQLIASRRRRQLRR